MSDETGSEHLACCTPTTLTDVVRADLQSLIPAHDETDLLRGLVLEETDLAGAAFLPLEVVLDEAEELCAPGVSTVGNVDEVETDILNKTSSSSSWVFASTCSVRRITGSN